MIESGTNLATDLLRGNNLSEGLNRKVNTFEERGAVGIEQLQKSGRNRYTKPKQKDSKLESHRYNFSDVTPKKKNCK